MTHDPIRLIHFADVHVGMENYGKMDPETGTSSRVRDFLDRLDEVVDYALEHKADLAIFAGDAFKNRDPEPTQQREFARRIKRLSDEVPTLLLVGNHDMPGMKTKASSLDIFQALDVPGVIVGHKPEGKVVETRRGPVYMAWMPYPMRNRLLASEEHRGKTIEELETSLRETVSQILQQLAEEASEMEMPRVLSGHFTVAEAKWGSERTVLLGRDVAVARSTLGDPAWDYVAMGHIHKHQDVNAKQYPSVVYSGSLERIDFGEEKEQKGFSWVELRRGETSWSFVPVNARPFVTMKLDLREADDVMESAFKQIKVGKARDAVVRVQVLLKPEQQAAFHDRQILDLLDTASSVTIAREVEMEARARLGDLSPESLTPSQLLKRYFESRGEPEDRIQQLVEKAEDLFRDPR